VKKAKMFINISLTFEKYIFESTFVKVMIQLGDKIELKEFNDLEPGELTVLKKMIGNHANHFQEFEKLTLHLKGVHKKEKSQKFQINGLLTKDNKNYKSESTNYNLFFAINEVLEKLRKECDKT